jgi:hypothetical protein
LFVNNKIRDSRYCVCRAGVANLDTSLIRFTHSLSLVRWLPPEHPLMPTDTATLRDWLRLIRAEYLEVPGLHLTKAQIQRMWGLDAATCDALIRTLVESRFLRRTTADRYGRFDAGA